MIRHLIKYTLFSLMLFGSPSAYAGKCSPSDFSINNLSVSVGGVRSKWVRVTGEIASACNRHAQLHLQVTGRGKNGSVLGTYNFPIPVSGKIQPNGVMPFSNRGLDYLPGMEKFSMQVLDVWH